VWCVVCVCVCMVYVWCVCVVCGVCVYGVCVCVVYVWCVVCMCGVCGVCVRVFYWGLNSEGLMLAGQVVCHLSLSTSPRHKLFNVLT
jgi:hypothetical protein